jgi:hypothetical protein
MLASLEFVAATTSSLALKFPGIPGIRRGKPAKPERSGCSFVQRALHPVKKIALAVQALPVVHADTRIKLVAVLEEIASLCVTVNEMLGQLEDSFQIGTGLPVEAFHAPGTPLVSTSGSCVRRSTSHTLKT